MPRPEKEPKFWRIGSARIGPHERRFWLMVAGWTLLFLVAGLDKALR